MVLGSQNMTLPFLTIIVILFGIAVPLTNAVISDKLKVDFYQSTCPQVEKIIADVMTRRAQQDEGVIPGVLRLHFHDCFITGCDGSILFKPGRYNYRNVEMNHPINSASLRGMEVIDEAKAELEKQCPDVVSCADILAYLAREAVVLAGNPPYTIPAGRRDGIIGNGNLAGGLPGGNESIEVLLGKYEQRGLTLRDMVVLEGAHSIGRTRCQKSIVDDGAMDTVPGSAQLVDKLLQQHVKTTYCTGDPIWWWRVMAPLNPEQNDTDWGTSFYRNILNGKSLIPSDLGMAIHPKTRPFVQLFATHSTLWKNLFNEAMIKLGKVNVLTGAEGEIRKVCSVINEVNMPV